MPRLFTARQGAGDATRLNVYTSNTKFTMGRHAHRAPYSLDFDNNKTVRSIFRRLFPRRVLPGVGLLGTICFERRYWAPEDALEPPIAYLCYCAYCLSGGMSPEMRPVRAA